MNESESMFTGDFASKTKRFPSASAEPTIELSDCTIIAHRDILTRGGIASCMHCTLIAFGLQFVCNGERRNLQLNIC